MESNRRSKRKVKNKEIKKTRDRDQGLMIAIRKVVVVIKITIVIGLLVRGPESSAAHLAVEAIVENAAIITEVGITGKEAIPAADLAAIATTADIDEIIIRAVSEIEMITGVTAMVAAVEHPRLIPHLLLRVIDLLPLKRINIGAESAAVKNAIEGVAAAEVAEVPPETQMSTHTFKSEEPLILIPLILVW